MKCRWCILILTLFLPFFIQGQGNQFLYNAYQSGNGREAVEHINLWRAKERSEIIQCIQNLPQQVKKELISLAERDQQTPWSLLLLSDFFEYRVNGNRSRYETKNFSRRSKLSSMVIAEILAGKKQYIKDIIDGIWLIMDETTWVLPAHLLNNDTVSGPDEDHPLIDLFVSETAAQLSWIKLLLGDEIAKQSPITLTRLNKELDKRVITPYLNSDDYWWMGLNNNRKQNNWNIWINSNVFKLAILACDDKEKRVRLAEKALRCADRFIDSYPSDGGCDEGPAYWSAAGGALGELAALLQQISGGSIRLSDNKLIYSIGQYITKVHIDSTRFVNFADATASIIPNPGRVYNFGELFDDHSLKSFAHYLSKMSASPAAWMGAGSINAFINNVRVANKFSAVEAVSPLKAQNWLPALQVLLVREKEGSSSGLTFMAKGGHNKESHNHNDVGNFMLYMNGSPVIIDIGKATYTRQTFGPNRYSLWHTQSQWHNCPTINGYDQLNGPEFKATDVVYTPGATRERLTMDIQKAYPKEAEILYWKRNFVFDRTTSSLQLTDSFKLREVKAITSLHLIACKKPVVDKRNGIILLNSLDQKSIIKLKYNPTVFNIEVDTHETNDSSLTPVWGAALYRISLQYKKNSKKGIYTINFNIEK